MHKVDVCKPTDCLQLGFTKAAPFLFEWHAHLKRTRLGRNCDDTPHLAVVLGKSELDKSLLFELGFDVENRGLPGARSFVEKQELTTWMELLLLVPSGLHNRKAR